MAGPSPESDEAGSVSAVQWVLSGGAYVVTGRRRFGNARRCGRRRDRVIHLPVVV